MTEPQDAFVARSTQSGNRVLDALQDLLMGTRRPFELRVDGHGIEVTGRAGVAASWADIADVYILTMGRSRYLVYQLTPEVAAAHGHGNAGVVGRWHDPALLYAPQPGVNLVVLDRDEHEVLAAVEHASGGRFPTPERVWNGRGGKDILRRDLHTRRPRTGRQGHAGQIEHR
ncbi:hypothetical protein [Pseudactinotalea terrae]|uniref:hypothetical protein n=1 Tax=Pseudactinotalea terrae TaxID=1743262 RepID=UPI0012E2B2FB|nr:hypothetical protein [Pseudactinotalea terrae]